MADKKCQLCGKKINHFPFGSRSGDCFCSAKCHESAVSTREGKKKILDVSFPKEEQEKSKELMSTIKEKKYQVTVKIKGKERYMYGNDPDILENYAKAIGAKIVKVTKL